MLPTKVYQLDYQDYGDLVWSHKSLIEEYCQNKKIKFDAVVAKLRNGIMAGNIISNYLGVPLAFIQAPRMESPESFELLGLNNLQNIKHILLVDAICGTGHTLRSMEIFFKQNYPQIQTHTYCTLVDSAAQQKPDICGELKKEFIQPPWEWKSFTPQSHLERLMAGHTKAAKEIEGAIAFSSEACRGFVEEAIGEKMPQEWVKVFSNSSHELGVFSSASGVSSISLERNVNLQDYRTKYKAIIEQKVSFLLSNGVSHYIEDDLKQAIVISQRCPVTHIFYFDGYMLNKIYAKQSPVEQALYW